MAPRGAASSTPRPAPRPGGPSPPHPIGRGDPARLPARSALAPPRLTLKVSWGRDAGHREPWPSTSGCCASGGCAPGARGCWRPGPSSPGVGRKRDCRASAPSGTQPRGEKGAARAPGGGGRDWGPLQSFSGWGADPTPAGRPTGAAPPDGTRWGSRYPAFSA